jgi:hypothetical protein
MVDKTLKKDVERLSDFLDELETIKQDIKKTDSLSKVSSRYQQNLEKLIRTTKNLLSNTASDTETKGFEKLVKTSDQSLKVMQKQNKNDEQFQSEFTEVFGDVKANEQASMAMFKRLGTTLTAVVSSANIVSAEARKDVSDTALSYTTGPFGKIVQDTFAGAGGAISSMMDKVRNRGQAHDGMTNVPKEGSYLLDGGERVLSGEQNTDLQNFMEDSIGGGAAAEQLIDIQRNTKNLDDGILKVFNADHDARYFDSLIDNDDRIAMDEASAESKHHKELKTKLEILTEVISGIQAGWLAGQLIGIGIFFRRFKRMPVIMSLGLLGQGIVKLTKTLSAFTGLSKLLGGIGNFLFGTKAKTKEDQIIQANEDITAELKKQGDIDRRTLFNRMSDIVGQSFGNVGKGLTNIMFGTKLDDTKRANARFKPSDEKKMEPVTERLDQLINTLNSIFGIQEELLEEAEKGGKKGGLLGMLGKGGKWLLGALGLTTLFSKLGPMIASALPGLLMRALPVGAALFAGFKLGEILNEKIGEWLDLDMDLGTYIGQAVFNFVDKITSWFGDVGRAWEEMGAMKFFGSALASGDLPTLSKDGLKNGEQRLALPEPAAQPDRSGPNAAQQFVGNARYASMPAQIKAEEYMGRAGAAAKSAGATINNFANTVVNEAKPVVEEAGAYFSQQ